MEFITQNIVWLAIAVVSGGMLLAPMLRGGSKNGVTTNQAVLLINRQDAVVVDVRSAEEFAGGHLPDARNIPPAEFDKRLDEIGKNRKRPVILVCQSGMRSATAIDQLQKAGFEQVFSLDGGIAAWSQAGQPLVRGA